MNRTTTVVVALIAVADLSTMVYAVLEQRALAIIRKKLSDLVVYLLYGYWACIK
jgi:hypothetical protein